MTTNKIEQFLFSKLIFYIFSIFLIIYIFVGLIFLDGISVYDYWQHLSTIHNLSVNITDTTNPYVESSRSFYLNTPYHVFWGFISYILNIHPFKLTSLMGAANISIFIVATLHFSKFVTKSKKYALVIAFTLLFFWYKPWAWSGFYNFGQLPLTSIYPFWFAFPTSLIIISKIGEKRSIYQLSIIIIFMALIFLIHPLTGSFLFVGVYIKALTPSKTLLYHRICIFASPFIAILLSLLWPYFSAIEFIFNSLDQNQFAGEYWWFYVKPWESILPSLLGLLYLPIAIKYRHLNFAIIGIIVTTMIFVGNRFTFHNTLLARYLIFIGFYLQISIIMLIKYSKAGRIKSTLYFTFLIILIIFGYNQFTDSIKFISIFKDRNTETFSGAASNIDYFHSIRKMEKFVSRNDIIMAPLIESVILPGIIDCNVVFSPHSVSFELKDEYVNRRDANALFFNDSSNASLKIDILKNNNAKYLMIPKRHNYSTYDSLKILTPLIKDPVYKFYKVQENQ